MSLENIVLAEYLLQNSQIICLQISKEGQIIKTNPFTEVIFGRNVMHDSLKEVFPDSLVSQIESITPHDQPLMLNLNPQKNLPCSFYFKKLPIDDGFFLIGEQNFSENEGLRRDVIELNSQLNKAMRELNINIKRLSQANQKKNQFMGIAAHDLRSPIATISSYCQLILQSRESLSPSTKEMLNRMFQSSHYMMSLLEDLLDISKFEHGNFEFAYLEHDMSEFLKDVIALEEVHSCKKNITINFSEKGQEPAKIWFDKIKLRQAISNLLTNAVKYSSPNSEIDLELETKATTCLIAIKDHGPGIPPQDFASIFEPFKVSTNRGTGNEKSTGLGLKIVKDIVQAHKGRIWVESEQGRGSTFVMELPHLSKTLQQSKKKSQATDTASLPPPISVLNPRILIVDDDLMAQHVMKKVLIKHTHDLFVANNGEEALNLLKKNVFDIIFVDEMMPLMSGPEFIRQAKSQWLIPKHTPIIALSANRSAAGFDHSGVSFYIQKPIKPSLLQKIFSSTIPKSA